MNFKNWVKLIVAIAVSELAGAVGLFFTVSSIPGWYADLLKSSLTPPNWLFGPVWTLLYIIMGSAAFLVWKRGINYRGARLALAVFTGQLILNAGWSFIFFGLHKPFWSLIEISGLWLAIVATGVLFYRISRPAAYLLIPYLLWVAFAAYLNYLVWYLNPSGTQPTPEFASCAQNIQNCPMDNLIRVANPARYASVSSPLTATGEARGIWFFEGVFPVKLYNAKNVLIAQGQARAQGGWTTSDFVPFTANLVFFIPYEQAGTLVLANDNPSGLEENSKSISLPLTLMPVMREVELYYYKPSLDMNSSGDIMCTRAGLVPVGRRIPVTQTPIKDTVNLLLQGNLTQQEKSESITTEFPLNGVTLQAASFNKQTGALTLAFNDPNNVTSGGSCRAGILWFQIEATAKQFPGVKQVQFTPAYLFQP